MPKKETNQSPYYACVTCLIHYATVYAPHTRNDPISAINQGTSAACVAVPSHQMLYRAEQCTIYSSPPRNRYAYQSGGSGQVNRTWHSSSTSLRYQRQIRNGMGILTVVPSTLRVRNWTSTGSIARYNHLDAALFCITYGIEPTVANKKSFLMSKDSLYSLDKATCTLLL